MSYSTLNGERGGHNPFLVTAGVYMVVDALVVATVAATYAGLLPSLPGMTWLRVHLLTIGVVTQAIFGSLPALTADKLGIQPPRPRTTAALWVLVNISLLVLLVSMPEGLSEVAAAGGVGILAAIIAMLAILVRQVTVAHPGQASRIILYLAGPAFFVLGILMALSMLLGWPAPGGPMGLLEAHVHANVWGFLALVVAGMLLDYAPRWAGRPLPHPALVPLTRWLLIGGAAELVAGPWLGILPMTVTGIAIYMTGTVLLLANIAGAIQASHGWTPNLAHLVIAYVWMIVPALVAPAVLVTTGKLPSGGIEAAAVAGLVAGWILQVALAALPLRLQDGERMSHNGWWFSVVTLNLGVLLLWIAGFWPDANSAGLPVAAGYALIITGWVRPLAGVLGWVFAPAEKVL